MPESDQPSKLPSDTSKPSRRNLLIVAGAGVAAGAAWFGWPAIERLIPRNFAFEPIPDMPGFRQFAAGQVSGSPNPFVGLDSNNPYNNSKAALSVRRDICGALFGKEPVPPGVVPIASFSDYNCPYCRVLSDTLWDISEASRGKIRITWHEWPTLGLGSRVMARAALAARRQGAYLRFHNTLMRTRFLPDSGYLHELAIRKGIDPDLMLADMKSPEIAWDIARSTALAKEFGLRGTPALVVGRTAVAGAIGRPTLEALIDLERKAGPVPACA